MANTGYKGYSTLEQYYTDNGLATGVTKNNTIGQVDYIATVVDETTCPTEITGVTDTLLLWWAENEVGQRTYFYTNMEAVAVYLDYIINHGYTYGGYNAKAVNWNIGTTVYGGREWGIEYPVNTASGHNLTGYFLHNNPTGNSPVYHIVNNTIVEILYVPNTVINVSPTSLSFNGYGGVETVQITSNYDQFTANVVGTGFQANLSNNSGDAQISITALENPRETIRTATVQVLHGATVIANISVSQEGKAI